MPAGKRFDSYKYSAGATLEDGFCKYLLLENNEKPLCICEAVPPPEKAAAGFGYENFFRLLDEQGSPREVPIRFALSFNESLIKIIDMPGCSLQEVKSALKYQFEDYFPFTYEESAFDVCEVNLSKEGMCGKTFVAAASRAGLVDGIQESAGKYGFTLSGVEPAQLAFERVVTPAEASRGMIEIYAGKAAFLFIFSDYQNGIFYRNARIKSSGEAYIEETVNEAEISFKLACSRIPDIDADMAVVAGPNAGAELCAAVARGLGFRDAGAVRLLSDFCLKCSEACGGANMILPLGAALGAL